jgi:sugar phosphate isomerase/epimerase
LTLSRRDLALLLPAVMLAEPTGGPHMRFPVTPRERLAVTSYPFRGYIDSPTNRGRKSSLPPMDLTSFPSFVIEKFGVRNINPLADHFRSTDDAYIASFRQALDKAGSHLVDLGLGGRYFYDSDPSTRQAAVEYGRKGIDLATKAGSPSVRQHLQVRRGQKPDVAMAAESLARLAEYGTKRNIVINLENDERVAEDPFRIVELIEKVNSPYLRALPDFGNTLIGHDAEYSQKGVKGMLGHAWNMCHVKDVVQADDGSLVKVDLAAMFALAKQSSYRGFYSMEFDTDAGDPITGTQKLVQETLHYLS